MEEKVVCGSIEKVEKCLNQLKRNKSKKGKRQVIQRKHVTMVAQKEKKIEKEKKRYLKAVKNKKIDCLRICISLFQLFFFHFPLNLTHITPLTFA